ncbi:MAG: Eco57I restriction-modification methylase domain-containing protein, partial [Planctomycetota bacterium]
MIGIQGDLLDLAGRPTSVQNAIDTLGETEQDERGAVFTRPEVVEFILDLVGYSPEQPLSKMRLLEPSIGKGAFLVAALQRLLLSFHSQGGASSSAERELSDAICGFELHSASLLSTRQRCQELLIEAGFSETTSCILLDRWLHLDDFLLNDLGGAFHFVVGNPPYVRQEAIPGILLAEYRRKFHTLYDRADLFVPFFQKGLSLLDQGGRLGFICSDRWLKNRYGGPLRQLIRESFSLDIVVDMNDTDAFEGRVSAYPAITVVSRANQNGIRFFSKPEVKRSSLKSLARDLTARLPSQNRRVEEGPACGEGQDPWLLGNFSLLEVISRIESGFPTLADAGCQVGIGVATGCDRVFVREQGGLPIENEALLTFLWVPKTPFLVATP